MKRKTGGNEIVLVAVNLQKKEGIDSGCHSQKNPDSHDSIRIGGNRFPKDG